MIIRFFKPFAILFLFIGIQLLFSCCNTKQNNANTDDLSCKELKKLADKKYDEYKYSEAYEYYLRLAEIEEDSCKPNYVYYRLGYCLFEMKSDYHKAIEFYKKSIENNFRVADAYHNIGSNYIILEMDSFGLVYFKEALRISPDHVQAAESAEFWEEVLAHKRKN